jgi:hypothetical protein
MPHPHCYVMVSSAPTGVELVEVPVSGKPTRVEEQDEHPFS